jgi:restriction system protein
MAVPTYDQFIPALFRILAAHPDGLRTRDACVKVADTVGVTADDRALLLPSGAQAIYANRIGWAHDRLKRAELSQSLRRGYWQLTEKGRTFAKSHPAGLDSDTVEEIANITRDSKVPKIQGAAPAESLPAPTPVGPQSPDERIAEGLEELQASVAADLLEQIGEASPAFFEKLVLDLLLAMGYGATQSDVQQVGGAGDGGIDGVIALDKLGLEKVYIQAKRWKANVGRPEIQGFFGALAGRRAKKGVFITTSSFSKEAREYAKQVSDSIVLVDGDQLTTFMIEHGVGVSHRNVRVPKLDGDYFEDA